MKGDFSSSSGELYVPMVMATMVRITKASRMREMLMVEVRDERPGGDEVETENKTVVLLFSIFLCDGFFPICNQNLYSLSSFF